MDLAAWIHTVHAPVILLNATEEAERICEKNGGLSVEQLFNGFGVFSNANTPVRTINGHINLPELRLRFYASSKFKPAPLNESAAKIDHVISSAASDLVSESLAAKLPLNIPPVTPETDVAQFLRSVSGPSGDPMPWYYSFKNEVMESFLCNETSMMQQPHAIMLVVSSTEADPRNAFHQLGLPQNLPSVFQDGLYDVNMPKYYIVLHDTCETEQTTIDPDALYRNLNLPANSGCVVRINSLSEPILDDLWSNHVYVRDTPAMNPAQPFGCFLSEDDRSKLRTMVWDFGVKFVIPAIESKILALNETVVAVRKGVRNALKAWWRKPKESTARVSAYSYRFDSIESNMRVLADMAFMIRDYDLAYNMYRLVRDDYKNDKAMLHYAHACESIALCLFMLKGPVADIHNALEIAGGVHARLHASSPQSSLVVHATRSSLLASEIYMSLFNQTTHSDLMDSASAALIRGSSYTDPKQPIFAICAAVLIERASFCDLLARNAKFRKYGFRMVMAGHVYSTLGHVPHAARCYSSARAIYSNSRWYQVDDHISGTLARQLYGLSLPQQAIALLITRIGTGRHTKAQQMTLLTEFYDMVSECLQENNMLLVPDFQVIDQADQKVLLVQSLSIPSIDDSSVKVFAPANANLSHQELDIEDTPWKNLEIALQREEKLEDLAKTQSWEELLTSSTSKLQLPLRNKKNVNMKKYLTGETIYVEFQVKNHLACEVVLSQLHLIGTFRGESVPSTSNSVSIEYQDVTLAPYTESLIRLSLCPYDVGLLNIMGVRWALNSHVHGEHSFNLPGVLLQDSLENRATRARSPNNTLSCDIQSAMPWLGASFTQDLKSLPSPLVCLEDEIVALEMHIKNHGTVPLSNMTVVCTNWQFVIEEDNDSVGGLGHVKSLSRLVLQPGESKSFRLLCRSDLVGSQTVRFLLRYSNVEKTSFRFVPLAFDIETLTGLKLTHAVHPSYDRIGEFVLALTVQNKRKDGNKESNPSMSLLKVVGWSPYWHIEQFPEKIRSSSCRYGSTLQWQEASTHYFRVTRRNDDVSSSSTIRLHPDCSPYSYLEFLCLDNAALLLSNLQKKHGENELGADKTKLLRSIQSVRRENKSQPKGKAASLIPDNVRPTSMEALLQPETDLHLIVQWSGTGAVVNGLQNKSCVGQTDALNVQIRSNYVPTSNVCPLTMTLSYPREICLSKTREVPLTLHLRNDMKSILVFEMRTQNPSTPRLECFGLDALAKHFGMYNQTRE
ncbi:hypothetical protein Ae201684P_002534 [Aphanomyces euteiches]|nr:hypothetical protein Ae201684P_002534 [Aphanomyces euteiches]